MLAIDLPNWMADLPDSVRLSDISLPGTHDTLTYAYGTDHDSVDTQDRSTRQQLESGIRFLDIRLRKVRFIDGIPRFRGHHGLIYVGVNFDQVLKDTHAFLAARPQETVLMRINTKETGGFGTPLPSDIALLNSYLDGSHADMGGLDTRSLLYRKPHSPTQLNLVTGGVAVAESTIPTLGDVRGKMVWFMDNWGDADPTLDQFADIVTPVDNGTYDSGIEVFLQMLDYLNEARLHSGARYTRFGATGQSFPTRTPYFVSVGDGNNMGVNKLANDHFASQLGLRSTGIITFDFPESHANLVANVIRQNQLGLTQLFVNVAGPAIPNSPLVDDPNFKSWTADTNVTNRRTVGSNTNTTDASIVVPPWIDAPAAIFQTHRSDPPGGNDMQWNFPVVPGEYQVKLYFAESNLNAVGARVFDVSIENRVVLDKLDVFAEVGMNTALQKTFIVTVDDRLNIDFSAVTNQPMLHGIEFRKLLPAVYRVNAGGPAVDGADGIWFADKELSSFSNNRHRISDAFTSLSGLTNTNRAVPPNHGSNLLQTPNISLSWNSSAGPGKWEQYANWPNDPGGGVYQMESGATFYTISFTPDPGWNVDLDSFDLNNDNGGAYTVAYEVIGSVSGAMASGVRPVYGNKSTFSNILPIDTVGVRGETLTLKIYNAFGGNGGNADELALDNLRFSQRREAQPALLSAETPQQIFQTERWDPPGQEEMRFDFPVVPGPYHVRLYFADNYISAAGGRVFDVEIEGVQVLDNFDIVAAAGARQGVVRTFFVNSDDNLDIDVRRVIENPQLCAIEIVAAPVSTEVSLDGGVLRITDVAGGASDDRLTISYSNGAYVIANPNLVLNTEIPGATGQGTGILAIPDAGIELIEFDTRGGNDVIYVASLKPFAPALVVRGGAGNDSVFFWGDLQFALGRSLTVDLTNDAAVGDVDRIEFAAGANVVFEGSGGATLKASRDIKFGSGSRLTVDDGAILLEANQQTNALAGDFIGVDVDGGTLSAVGEGSVTVRGRGGNGDLGNQFGVRVASGGKLQTNSGPLNITGTGGASTNVSNFGVYLTGQHTLASSVNGEIGISGRGGGVAGAAGSLGGIGVLASSAATIESTGMGNITVAGYGGVGSGGFNGGIEITGVGSKFQTNAGKLELGGAAGSGLTSTPLRFFSSSSVISTGSNIVLTGDDAIIDPNVTIAAISGMVTLQPGTAGQAITLGANVAGTLGLTDAELDRVTTGTLRVGAPTAGQIVISNNINRVAKTAIELLSNGNMLLAGGSINSADGAILFSSPGEIVAGTQGVDLITGLGNVSFARFPSLAFTIDGATAGSQYQQLSVNGSVSLTAASLKVSGSYAPSVGDAFVLISATEGISGALESVTLPVPPIGSDWDLVISANEVRLNLVATNPPARIPGDFNVDYMIDGRDFLVWQRGVGLPAGAALGQGDANDDGAVDAADLGLWEANFGLVLGEIAAAAVAGPLSFEVAEGDLGGATTEPTDLAFADWGADDRGATARRGGFLPVMGTGGQNRSEAERGRTATRGELLPGTNYTRSAQSDRFAFRPARRSLPAWLSDEAQPQ